MLLGEKIKTARKAKNLSQEKLAALVDVTTSTIFKIEKNKINPSFHIVTKICEALNISMDSLR